MGKELTKDHLKDTPYTQPWNRHHKPSIVFLFQMIVPIVTGFITDINVVGDFSNPGPEFEDRIKAVASVHNDTVKCLSRLCQHQRQWERVCPCIP